MAGIVRGSVSHHPIPDNISFTQYIFDNVKWPNRTAMINATTGHHYTYDDLRRLTLKLASGLCRNGLRKGDVICVFSTNSVEHALMILAVPLIGAIITGINPTSTAEEVERHVIQSDSRWIFVQSELLPIMKNKPSLLTKFKKVFVSKVVPERGVTPFWELLVHGDDSNSFSYFPINSRADVAMIPFSSGTTGLPKATEITHYNFVAQINNFGPHGLNILQEGSETYIAIFPFYHIGGSFTTLLNGLYSGSTIIILPTMDWPMFLHLAEYYKCTVLLIPPPIMVRLSKDPAVQNYDLSSVQTLVFGAAPTCEATQKEAMAAVGAKKLCQIYGMTENVAGTHARKSNDKLNSVGYPMPSCESKIVNPVNGEILGPYHDGEVVVRGPNVMKGYLNNPKATAEILDKDGWQKTGDIGHHDENGMLYIVDRLKELIKYKAYQVAPAELEAKLLTHPGIEMAAVIGIPDHRAGEVPKAFVVRKPNYKHLTEQAIVDFIKENVAGYKQLRGGVEFRDSVPVSASGKILRKELKNQVKATKSKL